MTDTRAWCATIGRLSSTIVLLWAVAGGCASYRPFTEQLSWQLNAPSENNPMYTSVQDHELLWATIFDVMHGHYEIAKSDPVRLYNGMLTEGRLTTKPRPAPTLLEPWHTDYGTLGDKCDSTLQTFRHYAVVIVVPEQQSGGGFTIKMYVYKELENLANPVGSGTSTANLRFDQTDAKSVFAQVDTDYSNSGWQLVDRDYALEEKLLGEIKYRLQHPPTRVRSVQEPIRG